MCAGPETIESTFASIQRGNHLHQLQQTKDEFFGLPGTSLRACYEAALELAAIPAAIRDYRRQQQLTQAELGLRFGVSTAISTGAILWFLHSSM